MANRSVLLQPFPFSTQTDASRAKVSSLANVVNMYLEPSAQGSTSQYSLINTPGLRLQTSTSDSGGIIGMHTTATKAFFCTPSGLYRLQGLNAVKVASATFVGNYVSMADNGQSLLMADGIKCYAYNLTSGALTTVDVPQTDSLTFIDGYFLANQKGTNKFGASNLLSTEFDPLQFASAEGSPDDILGIQAIHRELWIFGQRTIEIWFNSGGDFPFQRLQGGYIEKGTLNNRSFTVTDDSIFWLGDDLSVYRADGYTPTRISTFGVENILNSNNTEDAFMQSYSQEGHDFIFLTLPKAKRTLCFDAVTGLWHERTNKTAGRHLANVMASYSGITIVGDFQESKIYTFDLDYVYDEDELIRREVILPPIYFGGNRFKNVCLELLFQNFSAQAPLPTKLWQDMTCEERRAPDNKPRVLLSWTDNQGLTWTPDYPQVIADLGDNNMGVRWYKLGSSFSRTYRIRMEEPINAIWAGVSLA